MDTIDVTKRYLKLPNDQDFDGIRELFSESVSYISPALGSLTSKDEIIDKQKDFYNAHKAFRWYPRSYTKTSDDSVSVDYDCEATTKDGKSVKWSGVMYVTSNNGKITSIEIKIKP